MKGIVLSAGAVATGIALWVSAAGAAAGDLGPLAGSGALRARTIPLSAVGSEKPRALAGVPAAGSYGFLLRLGTESTARAYDTSLTHGLTRAGAAASAKAQLARVQAAERNVIAALPSSSHVLYTTHAVLAGVGVYTNVANLPALERISGVAAVYPIAPKKPSLSYSVLLQQAPQAWTAYGDLGANSTIAIIDSGIDYTHADFGGPGTTAAYKAALANDTKAPTYPDPGKIVGGYDFVGDTYNPSDPTDPAYQPVPHPDPNPLDCEGHGTHVAGIAAGYGENPNGTTFTGDYTTLPTDYASYQALFRIGPGMAPKAKLYAYRVFGCNGSASTNVIAAAIDRAADPNGDGNPSDHVGVINMSLGADFASPQDGDAVAASRAAQLGISVVAAAGNGGDLYDIAGSPGNATRVIAAAISTDAYAQVDTLHANVNSVAKDYAAQRSDAYDWASKPDLSGTVVALTQSTNKDGCDPISQNLTGKVVFLEWTSDDSARRCSSADRSQNAEKAGATGVIIGEDEETFSAGILGSADIPVVQVVKSAADAIRAALNAHQPVIVTSTSGNDFAQLIPGNNDQVASFSSRGIGTAGDVKPDVAAVGASVFSAAVGTGNQGISFSGTSMASPMVAGLSALVRSKYPGWNPEQVKADIMNTADQDLFTGPNHSGNRYAPERVGAGRIDAKAALDNQVLAYVAGDPGAVSASFGPLAVSAPTTLTKTIDVVNTSGRSATYSVAYDPLNQVPGATYSVSPSSVTLAAGQTKTVTLTLTLNPSQLTKPIDPTVPRTQEVPLKKGGVERVPREYVAEASGRVLLTRAGQPTLRVPVYAAPRPAATMTQPASIEMPHGTVQKGWLPLSGNGLNQGSGADRITSLVAGFELQAKSGTLPNCVGTVMTGCIHAADELAADLKYVGATSNAPELHSLGQNPLVCSARSCGLEYFAITTQGPWRTPVSDSEYDVVIDSNGDGKPDAIIFNSRLAGTDIFVSVTTTLRGKLLDGEAIDDRLGNTDAAVFNSDTLVMPVAIAALPGVSARHSRIRYGILTFGQFAASPVDSLGAHICGKSVCLNKAALSTDVLRPGVAVYGSPSVIGTALLYRDAPGTKLHVRRDAKTYAADHAKGALIVHFQDSVGHAAQVVRLKSDTTPPKVSGLKVRVDHRRLTARVSFHGSDPGHGSAGLHFKCKLDKGPFASCRSPKLYKRLSRGADVVEVKAIDKAGNVSRPVKRRFRV
jgi:subtilisin family serine protease